MAVTGEAPTDDADVDDVAPTVRWPAVVGTLLCLAGIGVATYLTITHYDTSVTLACPDKGVINCAKVTSSTYSKVFGIPVAVLGLAFFVSMLPLQLPMAWRSTSPLIRRARVAAVVVGIGFVMWLLYAELVKIKNICLYCTSVHAITFLLLITTVIGTISTTALPDE